MKKQYRRALLEYFARKIKTDFTDYETIALNKRHEYEHCIAFAKRLEGDARSVIYVCPSPKGDEEFSVVIGWSKLGRFPGVFATSITFFDESYFERDERLLIISKADGFQGPDVWRMESVWERPQHVMEGRKLALDEARSVVEPLAKDAYQRLLNVGSPVLSAFEEYWGDGA